MDVLRTAQEVKRQQEEAPQADGYASSLPPTLGMQFGSAVSPYLETIKSLFPPSNPYGQSVSNFLLGSAPESAKRMAEGEPNVLADTRSRNPLDWRVKSEALDMAGALPLATGAKALTGPALPLFGAIGSTGGKMPRLMTLFSGGGTYEQALKGKVNPVAAVEYDPDIGGHYKSVHGDHIKIDDVRNVDFKNLRGEVDILHASPVCKNYSGAKCGKGETPLDIMTAEATARALNDIEPRMFTLENVPQYQSKGKAALKIITDKLDELGYKWDITTYDAAEMGAPSRRDRIMLRASRETLPAPAPVVSKQSNWLDAVKDLLPTMKKSQLAPWQRKRLAAQGVDIENLDRPLIVGGGSGFKGQIPYAYADEPSFPIKATARELGGDRIVMPDGTTYTLNSRAYARLLGLTDDYPLPNEKRLAKTIVGNGMAPAMTQHVVNPLLEMLKAMK
jgi:DNA (cytosine-5)-methyltransferase 1